MKRILFAGLAIMLASVAPSAADSFMNIQLKSGTVKIKLLSDIAPNHVKRVTRLAREGAYDGIAFHRVIDQFMAQTGDVEYGRPDANGNVGPRAGTGDSKYPDLKAEFSKTPFERGTVGAARQGNPYINTANSQFFIMFDRQPYGAQLDGQYTVWGQVVEGIEHVDNIKLGSGSSGKVTKPDVMIKVTISDN